MPTTIQPLHNQVLVRMDELGNSSPLHLPNGSDLKHPFGLVLAVGPEVQCCVPGDRVLMLAGNLVGFTIPDSSLPVYLVTDKALLGKYVEDEDDLSILEAIQKQVN